jgi:hypothetical protein
MPWKTEIEEIKKKKSWWYRAPLPLKKQRVEARAERLGKCHIYSEEEKLVYLMKLIGREVSTE